MLNLREAKTVDVAVSLRLTDGTLLNGFVNCGLTGKLESVLSAENAFVEYTSKDGQKRFIARHQIASVEPMENMRAPTLRASEVDSMDAYATLGIFRGASLDQAKDAYHRLSKMYHPDRWSGPDVPREMAAYASDKFRQINAAFTAVRGEISEAERKAALAAEAAKTAQPAARAGYAKPLFGQG
jgi:hypothetical protein